MNKKLNKAQQEAVLYTDGPLLIVAGAGTGKTTVITEKIAHLVNNNFAKPENILALTFTDKAAGEMEERVDTLLDIGYADLQISTFHTFCQRILEHYGMDIGLSGSFKLLTDTDAWLLVRDNIYEFDLDYYRPLGNPAKHIHNLLGHFSKCKDELISPEEYLEYAENVKLDKDAVQTGERDRLSEIANVYHKYNQLLLDTNALDFGDLIAYAVKLLRERPNILKKIQERFTHVLVDEFQDVNYAQYELVKLLADESQLTVVGDDDQSVYAFRGASVSNILRFKDDFPKAKEIILTENYRSGQEILDTAYKSIQKNNPDRLEVKLDIDKRLKSKVSAQGGSALGGKIKNAKVIHLHEDTLENEVQSVVGKIIELKNENEDDVWDDFAILVRANNHAEPFLNILEANSIPYEFISSRGLYRQPIVFDCFAFFKATQNHYDALSIYRLLKLPFFELRESDLQKFTHTAKKKSISYYAALKRAKEFQISKEGVVVADRLLSIIHKGMKMARFEKPTAVLYHFLEESGYLAYLAHEEEAGNREVIRQIYQLKQFFEVVQKYERIIPEANVRSFVDYFEQVLESGDDGKLYQPTDTPDSVNIMTIHGSKGLEFKYVFVVNLVEGRFPSIRRGLGIELPDELIKEQLPEGDCHYQEERRLFYVATTRAKKELYFTSADNYGGVRKKKISRFLQELGYAAEALPLSGGAGGGLEKQQSDVITIGHPLAPPDRMGKKTGKFLYELPKAFSFSQIRAFQMCKYQYKLAHILKIPMKGSQYFSFGTSMHSTMQKFYERIRELNSAKQESLFGLPREQSVTSNIKVPSFEELESLYKASWIPDWYKSKRQREDYYKKGKDIIKEFYTSNDGNWTVPVSLEGWFKVKFGKYLVHGRIDRIDQLEDSTLEIIDYKTGASKEKLTGADKEQLLLYKIATTQLPEYRNVGQTRKLTFYYLNDNFKNSFEATEKEMVKVEEKIIKTLDEIHATDFNSIGKKDMCGRCEFCAIGLT